MNKLQLNKKTISQMTNSEMGEVNGGFKICLVSCANGTRRHKSCCDGPSHGIKVEPY